MTKQELINQMKYGVDVALKLLKQRKYKEVEHRLNNLSQALKNLDGKSTMEARDKE